MMSFVAAPAAIILLFSLALLRASNKVVDTAIIIAGVAAVVIGFAFETWYLMAIGIFVVIVSGVFLVEELIP